VIGTEIFGASARVTSSVLRFACRRLRSGYGGGFVCVARGALQWLRLSWLRLLCCWRCTYRGGDRSSRGRRYCFGLYTVSLQSRSVRLDLVRREGDLRSSQKTTSQRMTMASAVHHGCTEAACSASVIRLISPLWQAVQLIHFLETVGPESGELVS